MLVSAGVIEKLELQGDWLEATPQKQWQESPTVERIFHPRTTSEVDIVIYFRQLPIAREDGLALSKLLQEGDKPLDSSDIEKLGDAIGGFGDNESAEIRRSRIRTINGRRILEIDGQWLYNSNFFRVIIIDTDGSGCFPQQIYLMTPQKLFSNFLGEFDGSLETIAWRN
jgi:hypothetical protein